MDEGRKTRSKGGAGFHPVAWTLWLIGILAPALITRNPFYLLLMFIASSLVYTTAGRSSPLGAPWGTLVKTGLVLAAFGAVVNPLTVHIGEHVLFTTPSINLGIGTTRFLELGGRITLEALAYGLTSGLNLALLLLIFAAFNLGADHYRMLRAIPFHHTGVVLSIAFTFVPQMVLSLKRIREAQIVRGHRFRRVRDLGPLVIPLLVSGLERAIQLAESMEARGFSHVQSATEDASWAGNPLALTVAFFAVIGGMAGQSMLAGRRLAGLDLRWVATALLMLGLSLLLLSLHTISRRRIRTRYRTDRWRGRDTCLALASGITATGFAVAWVVKDSTLWFYPYPSLSLPGVNPWLVALSALTVTPVILALRCSNTG